MNSIDYIVVGLGNPDKKYESTRHNTGFMVVDYIAKKLNAKMTTDKFSGLCSSVIWNGKKILLLKPIIFSFFLSFLVMDWKASKKHGSRSHG